MLLIEQWPGALRIGALQLVGQLVQRWPGHQVTLLTPRRLQLAPRDLHVITFVPHNAADQSQAVFTKAVR